LTIIVVSISLVKVDQRRDGFWLRELIFKNTQIHFNDIQVV